MTKNNSNQNEDQKLSYDNVYSLDRVDSTSVEEILKKKTKIAFNEFEKQSNPQEKVFVVAGGVAANKKIRSMLINLCKENNYKSLFPPIELCGDNAAMIAMVGLEKYKLNQFSKLDHPAKPRWPLDEDAAFLKGAGVKL